jgi:16S rRNA (guanine966-N2)-methyltransferase
MGMRIVAGTAGGRRIEAPTGRATRPTTDRVRESIFNALGSLDAVEGARVLDLFAGSGALGLEALSRGAAHCTFVDADRRSIEVVHGNLTALALDARAVVTVSEATDFLRGAGHFDLVLLDPPYDYDGWEALLARINGDLAVIESDRIVDVGPQWETVRTRTYGSTVVLFARTVRGPAPE